MYCHHCGKPTGDPLYAGFWIRLAAYFIDAIVLNTIGILYGRIIGIVFAGSIFSIIFYCFIISTLVTTLYFGYFESSKYQATPGKQLLGVKVTDLEGNRITLKKAIARYLSKTATSLLLLIGYIAILFSEKKQGLYDMAVGTVVVYE